MSEFAAYGIAGARVDRIAAKAGSNKAQIYHYFGSKDRLFAAVFATVVERVVRDIPLEVGDLPGYAAKLARGYDEHPGVMRLVTWQRLERADEPPLEVAVASNQAKIAEIAEAQAAGLVSDRYPADVLLVLILHLAATWGAVTPELTAAADIPGAPRRYELVAEVVRGLLAP